METAELEQLIAAQWPDMPPDQVVERARVVHVLRTWLRTPYHHAAKIKGVGVDCATLIAATFEEAGFIEPIETPKYSPQWHLHRNIELYRTAVLEYAREITKEEARAGDVVLYRFGHVKAHGGLITERGWPFIIHAYSRAEMAIEANGEGGELGGGRETQFFSYWR